MDGMRQISCQEWDNKVPFPTYIPWAIFMFGLVFTFYFIDH